jgi:hypothetical protein
MSHEVKIDEAPVVYEKFDKLVEGLYKGLSSPTVKSENCRDYGIGNNELFPIFIHLSS